jgi:hypothetical protein
MLNPFQAILSAVCNIHNFIINSNWNRPNSLTHQGGRRRKEEEEEDLNLCPCGEPRTHDYIVFSIFTV